ncbi:hypothetical protein BC777_1452 [Yoonia maricola]|uniref:Lipoprotein n=1 Tax=Yoonia maricola TaxID=420999 RepID=A0A2M8WNT1_9RHOB|nr:hypothetical protein [Yoonia maricola]PJI92597.1 hypothetical protein BC777_1452 [Yoonia maricola]
MKLFRILSALVLISACTTFEDIDGGLDAFRGKPIDDLISIIGFPDGERSVAGKRLVVWSSSQNVTTVTPVTTYSSGTANAYGYGGYGYGSYSGTSTTYVPQTVNYNCTVMVEIDRNNRILGHDFEGNIGGCEKYAAALRPYLQEPQS